MAGLDPAIYDFLEDCCSPGERSDTRVAPAYRFAHAGYHIVIMSDTEKATQVLDTLKAAEQAPPQAALPMLNGLIGLVQGSGESSLEVEEARSSAFMAICEIGKALHRGQPVDGLWAAAIAATERWKVAR